MPERSEEHYRWRIAVEIFGIAAVVVSLLLLVYELRENTRALEATARQELAAQDLAYISSALDSSVVARAWAKRWAGEPVTGLELSQLVERQHVNFRIFENAFYQFSIGALEPSEWERYAHIIHIVMCVDDEVTVEQAPNALPAKVMWARYGSGFTPEFSEIVNDAIQACAP